MTGRFRHLAPAGAPVRASDLARWLLLAVSRADVSERLRRACCQELGVTHSYLASTGRAGMTLLLQALRRLAPAGRDEVILPSYTCYSVAASIVKAGLRPRVVDVNPDTLDYVPEELAHANYGRVLAVIATNLYGIPNDLPALSALARERGVFLVDDAAQALGASVQGRPCGTWGDVGLLSLDKGKNISAIDGGVILTGSDGIADVLEGAFAGLPSPTFAESVSAVAKVMAYFVLLRPWLYWIPNGIPHLGLGQTVYRTDFPIDKPSRPLVALGATMIDRLDEVTRGRMAIASALLKQLEGIGDVRTIAAPSGATSVYLRLPVLVSNAEARAHLIERLNRAGIGATGSYPRSIVDVPEVQRVLANPSATAAGGRSVARRIVTLPTHAFMSQGDIARTVALIREVVSGYSTSRAPATGLGRCVAATSSATDATANHLHS